MRVEYINVNANKLHDELIIAGIVPVLVESLDDKTWITFKDDVDMIAVQSVIDAHYPEPLPKPLTEIEQLRLEQAKANSEMIDLMMALIYGGM